VVAAVSTPVAAVDGEVLMEGEGKQQGDPDEGKEYGRDGRVMQGQEEEEEGEEEDDDDDGDAHDDDRRVLQGQ
jgi:hypothetical protein